MQVALQLLERATGEQKKQWIEKIAHPSIIPLLAKNPMDWDDSDMQTSKQLLRSMQLLNMTVGAEPAPKPWLAKQDKQVCHSQHV